jgi:hypothetical protein
MEIESPFYNNLIYSAAEIDYLLREIKNIYKKYSYRRKGRIK